MPRSGTRRTRPPARLVLLGAGGVALACVAGYINVVTLQIGLMPSTHVTGTVSRLSMDLAQGKSHDAVLTLSLLASFIAGAGISGVIIGHEALRLGRPYGVAMLVEACLLVLAATLIRTSTDAGILLAAGAAGLQNAMASSYGGQIVRTTHVTGIATDLGFLLGRWVRKRDVETWKFVLLVSLLLAFFGGGGAGWLGVSRLGGAALLVPAAFVGATGAAYLGWRVLRPHH